MKEIAKAKPAAAVPLNFQRPLCTVDVVIFTVFSEQLHVLLIQRNDEPNEPFPNKRALAGGFIDVAQEA